MEFEVKSKGKCGVNYEKLKVKLCSPSLSHLKHVTTGSR